MGSTARKIFVEPRRKRADLSDYTFTYNANADVLEATITQPLQAVLTGQDLVTLAADGTYQTLPAKAYKLGNILSYTGGYTQVSGFQNAEGDFVTLATAVVEGVNILEILKADRVVAQITSVMAPGDSVQSVSFAGSAIENLQINGQSITVSVNPNAMGPQPAGDGSYFDASNVPAGMTVSGDQLSGSVLTSTSIAQIVVPNFGTVSIVQLSLYVK
jgi:hypothetical protein